MAIVQGSIDFLQRHPLYEEEKPYYALVAPSDDFDPEKRLDNLEFETHELAIIDLRDKLQNFSIDKNGFQVTQHQSKILEETEYNITSVDQVDAYKAETEIFLKNEFDAEYVLCYDFRERRNTRFEGVDRINLLDPLLVEGPAKGAHSDVTFTSGPKIICRYLPAEMQTKYFVPGQYRMRIMNTWRSLIPNLEDRPLALCDVQSVDIDDLTAADRILPDRVGEVYYLHHNSNQQWYYLGKQQQNEPYIFVMYDTMAGDQAKCELPCHELTQVAVDSRNGVADEPFLLSTACS